MAEKPSDQVTPRQRLKRTKALEVMGQTINNNSMDVHLIHTLKRKRLEERKQILDGALGEELILHIPEDQANAMKADLGISWYRLNKLKRFVLKNLLSFLILKVANFNNN